MVRVIRCTAVRMWSPLSEPLICFFTQRRIEMMRINSGLERAPLSLFGSKGGSSRKTCLKPHFRHPPRRCTSADYAEPAAVDLTTVETVVCILGGGPDGITQTESWKKLQDDNDGKLGFAVYTDCHSPALGESNLPF